MYSYVFICMHTCVCIYIHIYVFIHIYIYTHRYVNTERDLHIYAYTYIYLYTYSYRERCMNIYINRQHAQECDTTHSQACVCYRVETRQSQCSSMQRHVCHVT